MQGKGSNKYKVTPKNKLRGQQVMNVILRQASVRRNSVLHQLLLDQRNTGVSRFSWNRRSISCARRFEVACGYTSEVPYLSCQCCITREHPNESCMAEQLSKHVHCRWQRPSVSVLRQSILRTCTSLWLIVSSPWQWRSVGGPLFSAFLLSLGTAG